MEMTDPSVPSSTITLLSASAFPVTTAIRPSSADPGLRSTSSARTARPPDRRAQAERSSRPSSRRDGHRPAPTTRCSATNGSRRTVLPAITEGKPSSFITTSDPSIGFTSKGPRGSFSADPDGGGCVVTRIPLRKRCLILVGIGRDHEHPHIREAQSARVLGRQRETRALGVAEQTDIPDADGV